jgi:hypothetical protein
MREEYYFYAHVNFTARASGEEEEEGSSDQEQQQQLFVELLRQEAGASKWIPCDLLRATGPR